jgi:hypothetical protein
MGQTDSLGTAGQTVVNTKKTPTPQDAGQYSLSESTAAANTPGFNEGGKSGPANGRNPG